MALTDREKDYFTDAIADTAASEELIGIIDGGSATTLTDNARTALRRALPAIDTSNIETALETGSATLTDIERDALKNLMGDPAHVSNLETLLEAIS